MTLRSLAIAAVFVGAALSSANLKVCPTYCLAQQTLAADVTVPGLPVRIALDVPSNPFTAQATFRKVLDAAGVRYGIEGPAWDPATPPLDFARARESTVQLSGRRLGEALDLIVKAAPQYRWTELSGGVIVIRSSPAGDGILDRQIPQFSVTNAPPRAALEALMAALDPSRPRGLGIMGAGQAPAGAAGTPAPAGRNVTLSLTNATLETVLSSVARLSGELAWIVQYDRAPATLEHASITFIEHGQSVTAQSRQTAGNAGTLRLQSVPILSTVASMLSSYALRNPTLKLSVEEVEGPRDLLSFITQPAPEGLPLLELPDNPAVAIARIIALDSRYESMQVDGRFRVRPKEGVPGRIDLLEKTVNGFTAANEPARAVIERIGRSLGAVRPMGVPTRAESIQRAMATPLSIDLRGTVTVREALDAIADATGWHWSLRPTMTPGQRTMVSVQWRGVSPPPSVGNWSTDITITLNEDLSPAATPVAPPTRLIPATLDRDIPQTSLTQEPGPGLFQQLAVGRRLPLMIEELPPAPAPADPRRKTRAPAFPVVVGPGRFSDAIYVLLERMPEYEIVSTDRFVNIAPVSLASSDYFMIEPLRSFEVRNVGLFRAMGELRRALDPQFVPTDWTGDRADILNRRVTLSMTNATPRDILNRLAAQHGDIIWASSFLQHRGVEHAVPRVADWVLTMTPMSVPGPVLSLSATGPGPASALVPRQPPPNIGRTAITIDLPVTPSSLRAALLSAARAMDLPFGFEAMAAPAPAPAITSRGSLADAMASIGAIPARSTDYYDLTGLNGGELMDTLETLAPDYEFTSVNGIQRVRPRVASGATSWLDQRIDRFEHRFDSLRDAQQAIVALGRGGVSGSPELNPAMTPPPRLASPATSGFEERLRKSFTVSLTNTTMREILDEIAREFGRVMWSAEPRTTATTTGVTPITLTFWLLDGGSIATSIGTSVR